jgi:hypothetical protein
MEVNDHLLTPATLLLRKKPPVPIDRKQKGKVVAVPKHHTMKTCKRLEVKLHALYGVSGQLQDPATLP